MIESFSKSSKKQILIIQRIKNKRILLYVEN